MLTKLKSLHSSTVLIVLLLICHRRLSANTESWSDTTVCAPWLAHQRAVSQPVSSATVPSMVLQQMGPVIHDSDDLNGLRSLP